MQALAERFRPAAALMGWGLLWAALGVAVLGVFPGPVLALATAAGTFIR